MEGWKLRVDEGKRESDKAKEQPREQGLRGKGRGGLGLGGEGRAGYCALSRRRARAGTGNGPSHKEDFMQVVRVAVKRNILVVAVTQVRQ